MLTFDASDYARIAAAFGRLPVELRVAVYRRVMGRMTDMVRTRFVRLNAERIDVPPAIVRERTTAKQTGDGIDVGVRSDWIPLIRFGARETRRGVSVRARGSYAQAFIARSKVAGSPQVMRRDGSSRLPVSVLFGPNPANDVVTDEAVYLGMLVDVVNANLMPRLVHEMYRVLPR